MKRNNINIINTKYGINNLNNNYYSFTPTNDKFKRNFSADIRYYNNNSNTFNDNTNSNSNYNPINNFNYNFMNNIYNNNYNMKRKEIPLN